MSRQETRWEQRLSNYNKAPLQLEDAVVLAKKRALSNLEEQGLIQAFEFTHELAWKVMKDYFEYQGNANIDGSRDATREAFQTGLVIDGEGWMEMIKSRNSTSQTYNEKTAAEIARKVIDHYFMLFKLFQATMENRRKSNNGDLLPSI